MEAGLMQQGVDLMLYGMGTVFTFLILLVGAIYLMSWLISRFFPEAVLPETPVTQSSVVAVEPRVRAVIQGAIDQHRSRQ